jgi:hypothetical protein
MSKIPELMGGRALEHNAPFETGKGISNKDGTATITAAAGGFTWTGDLDLNDNLDLDVALTGTGDAANIAATISHATQSAEALDVSIAQITNVRTSGDVVAVKASITSLTGTTAGVDHVAYDGACTAGDADSDHILLRQGANFSRTIDSSAAATGEVAWYLGANKADALSILDSTGDMVVYTTTTATPGIAETFARTGAGNAHSIAMTANSASATMVGLAVSASQITTARTSGTLSSIKSTVVSLSGDTAGVDYYCYEAAVTAGEAGADHIVMKQGAGFDAFLDVSAAATGEADVILGDNLAEAFTFRESTNSYLTFVTTNSSESVAVGKRLTTTDGIASGDAIIVGGRLYTQTSASTAITATASETTFDQAVYEVKANTLTAGKILRIKGQGIATATNASDTLTIKVKIGGTTTNTTGDVLIQTAAVDVANNDIFAFAFDLIPRAAPGATAACVGHGHYTLGGGGAGAVYWTNLASTNLATNGALPVKVTATWSSNNAGNSCRMDVFSVEVI